MGLGFSKPTDHGNVEKKSTSAALPNTKVQRDRTIELPAEYKSTKKDVCMYIRKCFDFKDDEDITEEVNRFCTIKEIEEELFEDSMMTKLLPIRLYIR